MLTEICLYLKNWFNENQPRFNGEITIENGAIVGIENTGVQTNQYYRITGSVFNDGVYKRGSEKLVDEVFTGAIWLMAVPPEVISLATEIGMWQDKYGGVNSQNMSPYNSESFGGYSYTKAAGGSGGSSSSSVPTWQGVFADRLRRYKKL